MSDRYLRTWTRGEVLTEVVTLLADHLDLPKEEVTPASNIDDDLGADSLDHVEILMGVEEAFGLEDLLDEKTKHVRTVSDLVAVAVEQLGKRVVAA